MVDIFVSCQKNFKVKDGNIDSDYWVRFFAQGRSVKTLLEQNQMKTLAELLSGDLSDIDDPKKFNEYDAKSFFLSKL